MKDRLRILITNDDGIDAPGLAVLTEAAKNIARDVDLWVVAPKTEQSGKSQCFTINAPLDVCAMGHRRFAVSGTPADCVILAMQEIMKDSAPDLVLSGVNAGVNVGNDVFLSGTLGAAFTALMYNIPSIGISQKRAYPLPPKWETARAFLPGVLKELAERGWEKGHCLSINLPDAPPEEVSRVAWTRPSCGATPPFATEPLSDGSSRSAFSIYPRHPEEPLTSNIDSAVLLRGEISISVLAFARGCVVPSFPPPSLQRPPFLK